jgi:hypothetical protein
MESKYLGIDGQYIPQNLISFDVKELQDGDRITGASGECLIYIKEEKSYRLFTNQPNIYLTTPYQKWQK